MQTQTPCSDYVKTKGLIYFARMLDKIRLKAAGKLASEYFTGVEDRTHFDARCTRFLGVNYDELVERTLQGGSDEGILEWCFARGRRPGDEEISIWNTFLRKRGWRDEASEELAESKKKPGFICTTLRKDESRARFSLTRQSCWRLSKTSIQRIIMENIVPPSALPVT